jgi:tRNA-binding EMAP/Myf-like protein
VVAGLASKIPTNELIGGKVVAITNLKPARMCGIESTAMLLAASNGATGDEEIVELLQVPESVPNGELLSFEGKEPSEPDAMLKSKGALKAWDRAKAGLLTNGSGEATYRQDDKSYRMMSSGGPVMTLTLKNAIIQ